MLDRIQQTCLNWMESNRIGCEIMGILLIFVLQDENGVFLVPNYYWLFWFFIAFPIQFFLFSNNHK